MNSEKKLVSRSAPKRPRVSGDLNTSISQQEIMKLQKASMVLEDLIWSLKSQKIELLQDAIEILNKPKTISNNSSPVEQKFKSGDPNRHFLIGILPSLFQDKILFPSNEDIVDFANNVLGLTTTRATKRSRYELIGLVVCETIGLSEHQLADLVHALEKLVGNKDMFEKTLDKKKKGSFSWNETIQELLIS